MSVLQQRGLNGRLPRSSRAAELKVGKKVDDQTVGGNRQLLRMLGVFEIVARSPDGLSLAEISNQLSSPKSSLLTLLRPLVARNYLTHANNRYSLGNESFVLATNIISARKFGAVVRGLMAELQRKCPETVILVVIDRAAQTAIYSDVMESPQSIRYSVPAGTTRPLFTSAAGQLLLAYQSEKWRNQYLRKVKLKPLTIRTITNMEELRKKLDTIVETGLSISISEAVEGATGVAAPIFGPDGTVLAALLVAGPTERHAREGKTWSEVTREFADKASRALGFTG